MTDNANRDEYGDPLSAPFWAAATAHRLVVQRCGSCGRHQHYPRPFCLGCESDQLSWVDVSGEGTVHSQTTIHMPLHPELQPPYVVAVVELDEGPRLTTNIVGGASEIGSRVRVTWQDRADAPPLPLFTPIG